MLPVRLNFSSEHSSKAQKNKRLRIHRTLSDDHQWSDDLMINDDLVFHKMTMKLCYTHLAACSARLNNEKLPSNFWLNEHFCWLQLEMRRFIAGKKMNDVISNWNFHKKMCNHFEADNKMRAEKRTILRIAEYWENWP